MKHLSDDVRRMIRLNSVSSNGNEELSNFVAALLQDRGLKTQLQQVMHSMDGVSKRQFNVIGVLGDPLVDKKTQKGLLLSSHLDTLSPGLAENWNETSGDPFSVQLKDGKVFGLGTASSKIDFLCKLKAIEKFREKKLKMPIYLVGTCGGEIGMLGARYLIKSLALNPKYVLVGEPTDLRVVFGHKSLQVYKVSIGFQQVERDARGFNRRIDLYSLGKAARASHPALGTNAIHQMVDFVRKATESGFELRFTKLEGGDSLNQVPDRGSCEFFMTSHQFEEFKRFFRETVKAGGLERAFRVELGGLGESGVRFLPEAVFRSTTDVLGFFSKLGEDLRGTSDGSFDPPASTVSLSMLRQNTSSLDLYFDIRILPNRAPQDVHQLITQGIQSIATRYPSLNLSAAVERSSPGLTMSFDHELVRICQEAMQISGIAPVIDKKSTTTEAALYFQAGYEAIAFGPGASQGSSGSPNEHNLVEQMEKAIHFYEKVIERICL